MQRVKVDIFYPPVSRDSESVRRCWVLSVHIMFRFLYPYFSGNFTPFVHRMLTIVECTFETVFQHDSSETVKYNFMKVCSNKNKISNFAYLQDIIFW